MRARLVVVAAALLTILSALKAQAACRTTPEYHELLNFIGAKGIGSVSVWIPRKQYSLDAAICVAQTLKDRHTQWRDVVVFFFNSRESAEEFDPTGMNDERIAVDGLGQGRRT